jgi:hypothetical protein
MYRTLLGAAVSLVIAMPATAQAQCNYRMNDVGRPHGYLSGPCNGAAQNYNGAYRSRAATEIVGTRTASGAIVRTGNVVRQYDTNGRLLGSGVKRGDVLTMHPVNGGGSIKINYRTGAIYDGRNGRFVGRAHPSNLR